MLLITDEAIAVDSALVAAIESGECVDVAGKRMGRVGAISAAGALFLVDGEAGCIYLGGTRERDEILGRQDEETVDRWAD